MNLERLKVGRTELAKILGCSTRQVTTLEADGVITPTVRQRGGKGSQYDLATVVPAYIRHVSGGQATGTGEREARRRRDQAQAEFVELKIRKERGELIERDVVIREGMNFVMAWKAKVLSWPHRLRQSGLITPENFAAVKEISRELLVECSAWETSADVQRAIDEGEKLAEGAA